MLSRIPRGLEEEAEFFFFYVLILTVKRLFFKVAIYVFSPNLEVPMFPRNCGDLPLAAAEEVLSGLRVKGKRPNTCCL